MTRDTFIDRATSIHAGKFSYDDILEKFNSRDKLPIRCPTHGTWFQTAGNHLSGHGCPSCNRAGLSPIPQSEFMAKLAKVESIQGLDFSQVVYTKSSSKVKVICPKHGEFCIRASNLLRGVGCPQCAIESKRRKLIKPVGVFIDQARAIHGDKYDYSEVDYTGAFKRVVIGCPEHGEFQQSPDAHLNMEAGCPRCQTSKPEMELFEFVSHLADAKHRWPIGRRHYDVYVPSLNLAFELHGLIWHSSKFSDRMRDYDKYKIALSRGDRLVQIYEDEWRDRRPVMEEFIRSLFPSQKQRIRPEYHILAGTSKEARAFLDTHHYLGAASGCLTVEARHAGAIVGVWVFMKRESDTVLWHRACWDHRFKAWHPHEKALRLAIPHLHFKRIVTFSDNRLHTGKLYERLGFSFNGDLPPDYCYANVVRKSKYAFRVPAGVNEELAAGAKGWFRLYDSGKKRWELRLVEENAL